MKPSRLLIIIVCIAIIAGVIGMPREIPINFSLGNFKIDTVIRRPNFDFMLFNQRIVLDFELKKGLDLQGGTHVVLRLI
jgi:hypothetical protein